MSEYCREAMIGLAIEFGTRLTGGTWCQMCLRISQLVIIHGGDKLVLAAAMQLAGATDLAG